MMKKPFTLILFWAFVVWVILIVLQIFPKPGIYLMIFGAPRITGFLIQVLLVSLVIEALLGRIPKLLSGIPLLAICRIGQADSELVDAFKQEFQAMTNIKYFVDSYHQALFLTLLQLGERNFIEKQYRQEKLQDTTWYEAVLSGQGQSAIGPNNCMVKRWPFGNDVGPAMASIIYR